MRSSFFEFNVATTGLFSARAGLDVTSHNISNAATRGYSRQYIEQKASNPLNYYNGKGMIGTGSTVYGVGQHRDFYLDKKYWNENPVRGEFSIKASYLDLMEGILNEISDTGLKSSFDSFFESIHDLSTTTPDNAYRTNVIQYSQTLSKLVNNSASSLKKQQSDLNQEVKAVVDIINSYGEQIKSLNTQISRYEADGSRANDLRDERIRIIDELSKYVNVEVEEIEYNKDFEMGRYPNPEDRSMSDKRFSVTINGYDFVTHNTVNTLKITEREEKSNPMDIGEIYDISFQNGMKFDMYSKKLKGELKGLIDLRDGNNGNLLNGQAKETSGYKGVPHYMNKLNELVRVFSKAINEGKSLDGTKIPGVIGHTEGFDKNGDEGLVLFTYDKNATGRTIDYSKLTCENFQVNAEIVSSPEKLATSEKKGEGESDNRVILGFIKINTYESLFAEGKLQDYITGLTSELAIDTKQAKNFTKNYNDILSTIDNQRISIYGVDTNEEVVNLIKYNQLYQASAKLINIIDGIYDTCINRLGV